MAFNPYQKYQDQSVMTMTHGEMLVKLYDEAILQMRRGAEAIGQHDIAVANAALLKAQNIFWYLRSTLDFKYEISDQLARFYDFFTEKLIQANIRKSDAELEDIIALTGELRDAFAQSEKLARMELQGGAPTRAVRIG